MREIKTAVITGSSGVIGTALCKLLTENGKKVFAVTRPGSRRGDHLKKMDGVHPIECDASNLLSLPDLVGTHADAFFHFAWDKTVGAGRNDMDAQIKNIQYTIDAVRAASTLDCKVFIGAGSQAEYGRVDAPLKASTPCFPENGYGMAKHCAGQMSRVECKKLGIDHIWPRILSIYGPYDNITAMVMGTIDKLLKGEKPSLTVGEQIWDFLYADDAAEALYQLALRGKNGMVYPVGNGAARPLREYIEIIRDEINPSLPLGFGDIPYGEKQVMHLEADITALREDTGFEPHTDFRAGIRKTIDYIRRQNNG